ncbi:TPR repeat [Spirosomataceae bacterium TFI 002]|nr:TPR repeat [Spirosomataceae bacterium TFI 002]
MDITTTEKWNDLLKKADLGDTSAQFEVATVYENGLNIDNLEIVKKDIQSAFSWTKKAFENGHKEAKISYAHYLTNRNNPLGILDIDLGMKLYEEEMNNGNNYATYCLGLEYRNKQEYEKAFDYYERAHRNEEFFQELTIGMCYYYGVGVTKDKLKALEIFKSITLPNVTPYEVDEANYMIGKIYLEGEVIEKDIDKARFHLELAGKDGDHRSAQEILLIIGRTPKNEKNTSH